MSKGKGQSCYASNMGDKGIPKGALPKSKEKKGTIQFSNCWPSGPSP